MDFITIIFNNMADIGKMLTLNPVVFCTLIASIIIITIYFVNFYYKREITSTKAEYRFVQVELSSKIAQLEKELSDLKDKYKKFDPEKRIDRLKVLQSQKVNSSYSYNHNNLLIWGESIKTEIKNIDSYYFKYFDQYLRSADTKFRLGFNNSDDIEGLYSVLEQAINKLERKT